MAIARFDDVNVLRRGDPASCAAELGAGGSLTQVTTIPVPCVPVTSAPVEAADGDRPEDQVLATEGFAMAVESLGTRVCSHGEKPSRRHGPKRCQFCSGPIPARHSHVLDTVRCAVWCTCAACSVVFHFADREPRRSGSRAAV